MASQLNWIGTVVTDDGTVHADHQVVVRKNTATVTAMGHEGATRDGVVAVEMIDALHAQVRFEDGTAWAVNRAAKRSGRGCGCGQ